MSTFSYDALNECLTALGTPHTAMEVHGLVTGMLAAGGDFSASATGPQQLAHWLDVSLDAEQGPMLTQLFGDVAADLKDTDMAFALLLPDDDSAVAVRTAALGLWCAGFLSGFGLAGRFEDNELSEDVRELLTDLGKIAHLDEEVPDDEDNEADLVEISEYVRMSALLVFTECARRPVH